MAVAKCPCVKLHMYYVYSTMCHDLGRNGVNMLTNVNKN